MESKSSMLMLLYFVVCLSCLICQAVSQNTTLPRNSTQKDARGYPIYPFFPGPTQPPPSPPACNICKTLENEFDTNNEQLEIIQTRIEDLIFDEDLCPTRKVPNLTEVVVSREAVGIDMQTAICPEDYIVANCRCTTSQEDGCDGVDVTLSDRMCRVTTTVANAPVRAVATCVLRKNGFSVVETIPGAILICPCGTMVDCWLRIPAVDRDSFIGIRTTIQGDQCEAIWPGIPCAGCILSGLCYSQP